MRIFLYELRKVWNWKVLLVIAAFAMLTMFAVLAGLLHRIELDRVSGRFGSYQIEMFRLYGDTLEPEELAEFNIPQRMADITAELETVIANEPVFAKYGITNIIEHRQWEESLWGRGSEFDDEIRADRLNMDILLMWGITPDGMKKYSHNHESLFQWQRLRRLEQRYACQTYLETRFIESEHRSVVIRAARELSARGNNSLLCEHLLEHISMGAAVIGVFSLAAVMVLIIPLLLTDRSRKINMLQYSSAMGRKIMRTQLAATLVSAFVLSLVLCAGLFAPFLLKTSEYWNASIFHSGMLFMWLYDITFGQYIFLLTGMITAICVCAACVAFILARFSANIINVMVKAVPAGIALAVAASISLNMALADTNTVFNIFGGRIDLPEVIVCGIAGIIGVIAAIFVVIREKRVDLL